MILPLFLQECTLKTNTIWFPGEHMEEKVELSAKRLEQLQKAPIVESFVTKSQDGKWVIHKTTITDIKPVQYLEKVLQQKAATV